MRWNRLVLSGLLALLVFTGAAFAQEGEDVTGDSRFAGDPELAIPEFPEDIDWINIDGSLSIDDLRGKIVIFDFWTYGCINCIHMIPVLQRLEEEYAEELVVIGVHSAKFQNEGETENIEQIVQRYGVHHPVINDSNFTVWRTYGIRAWPTLVIVDPRGNVLAAQSGEIPYEGFKPVMDGMIEYFDGLGEINREPLAINPEGSGRPNSLLSYPGKVLVDTEGERLFIADSSNHRYIIADLNTYEVLDVIGTGQPGFNDGEYNEATFSTPQGMALRDDFLYVADTNNHVIRMIDLQARKVFTMAGTGEMGQGIQPFNTVIREPRGFALRSPWDVEFGEGDTLYIAMAGTHQIWEANVETGILQTAVGNGRESALNSRLDTSELAQPSGLYFNEGLLYFADSESSTIRIADFNNGTVMTASGTLENNLFDFGDVDGPVGESRLQHALGVDGDGDGTVYVADTYNSKIKVIDSTMNTTTIFGQDGNGGFVDGGADVAAFDEPGGLDYVEIDGNKRLYVADTNNHAIRVIDLDENTVSTIQFPNPEALQIEDRVTVIGGGAGDSVVRLDDQSVSAGEGNIVIRLQMPEGYKLNDLATSLANWTTEDEAINLTEMETVIDGLEVNIPVSLSEGEGTLNGDLTIYFCEAVNESLCFIDQFAVEVPVSVSDDGNSEILIERELIPPQVEGIGGIG